MDVGTVCTLITGLHDVFLTLRTMAFVGAAFVLAAWAWTFIVEGWGKGDKNTDLEGAKKKGIGLLIGFVLLFGLGMVMQFLPGTADCGLESW